MRPAARGPAPMFLAIGALLLGGSAVLASVAVHPFAGLGLVCAGLAAGMIPRHEFGAVQILVFGFCIIPIYFRIPGASFLYPPVLLLLPLLAIVLVRTVLHRGSPCWSRMHSLAALSLLAVAVTSINPEFSGATFREIFYQILVPMGVFGVAFHAVRREADARRLLDLVTLAAVIQSLYGVLEFAFGGNWLLKTFYIDSPAAANDMVFYFSREQMPDEGIYRVFGTFINPIELATFLGMAFAYPFLGFLHGPSRRWRIAYGLSAALILVGLFLTFSRGSFIAAAAVFLILFVLVPDSRRMILSIAFVAILSLAILYPLYTLQASTRLRQPETVTTRLGLYRLAFFMFLDHPVFGVGYGNFKYHLLEYVDRYGAKGFQFPPEWWTLAENTYLHLMSEMGLVGLAAHLAVLTAFFASCIRLRRSGMRTAWYATAIGMGGVAYAVNGMGSGSAIVFMVATQFLWLQIALVARLDVLQRQAAVTAPKHRDGTNDGALPAESLSRRTPFRIVPGRLTSPSPPSSMNAIDSRARVATESQDTLG